MMGKVDRYHWVDIGSSYVPSEVSCAILWAQLDACQQVTKMRRQFFEDYQLALSKGPATAVNGNHLLVITVIFSWCLSFLYSNIVTQIVDTISMPIFLHIFVVYILILFFLFLFLLSLLYVPLCVQGNLAVILLCCVCRIFLRIARRMPTSSIS